MLMVILMLILTDYFKTHPLMQNTQNNRDKKRKQVHRDIVSCNGSKRPIRTAKYREINDEQDHSIEKYLWNS
jgi:hypothetical protein